MKYQRVFDLTDADDNTIYNVSVDDATTLVEQGVLSEINSIDGHFGLVAQEEEKIRMARTIGVVRRYFVAKIDGQYCVVFSDRIDKIQRFCLERGIENQFDPFYTRMVPAHYLVEIDISANCRTEYHRFLPEPVEALPADIDFLGQEYITALYEEIRKWLTHSVPRDETIGVMLSGGVDSTAIFLLLVHGFKELGRSLNSLKAFTLSVDGGGTDFGQAKQVIDRFGLHSLWEAIPLSSDQLSLEDAIYTIEDYHPLDVQCATACVRLAEGMRARYPNLLHLTDGDGNDENLKSYPLNDSNLTLEDVISIPLLYQEGWGIKQLKHSLTFSNGLSRSYIRSYAVGKRFNFRGVSHFVAKPVIQLAAAIPFRQLVQGIEERLFSLKGEITKAGVKHVTGLEMPVFPKVRFQQGAMSADVNRDKLTVTRQAGKAIFNRLYGLPKKEKP